MSDYEQRVKEAILSHYMRQTGTGATAYPVFRGAPYQYGNGIGDIFKSIGRFLLPILMTTARSFAQHTMKGMEEGQTFQDAAKHALKPTAALAAVDVGERLMNKITSGGGRSRKRKHAASAAKKKHKKPKSGLYKGHPKRRRKAKSKTTRKHLKTSQFTPLNF